MALLATDESLSWSVELERDGLATAYEG